MILKRTKRLAEKYAMLYQSVHALFGSTSNLWKTDGSADTETKLLIKCIKDAATVALTE